MDSSGFSDLWQFSLLAPWFYLFDHRLDRQIWEEKYKIRLIRLQHRAYQYIGNKHQDPEVFTPGVFYIDNTGAPCKARTNNVS